MEIQISQDIRKFKTKDIGNFSFKEIGFLVIGFGLAFGVYTLTEGSIPAALIPFAAVAALAFLKPHGMTAIEYIRTVWRERITPSVYINETDFEYDMDALLNEYGSDYNVILTDNLNQSNSVDNSKTKKNIYEEALIIK